MASSCEARRSKLREPLFVVGAVFCVGYGGRAGRMVSWRYPEPASGFWGPWCVASALLARPTQQAHTEGHADELRLCEFTQRRSNSSRFCENDASVKLRLRVMAAYDTPRVTQSTPSFTPARQWPALLRRPRRQSRPARAPRPPRARTPRRPPQRHAEPHAIDATKYQHTSYLEHLHPALDVRKRVHLGDLDVARRL